MICNECETVAHCAKHGCIPKQPTQQEPVAWMYDWICDGKRIEGWIAHKESEIPRLLASNIRPLYTTPQPAQPQQEQQEPVGCEGAVVNGRVYADRLEHDYKFECEAGPLHLCADWVELRRCFEWMAQHTSPPAQRTWVGLTPEEVMESWEESRDGDWAPDFYAVIEAKLKERNQ